MRGRAPQVFVLPETYPEVILRHDAPVIALAVGADGGVLAALDAAGTLRLANLRLAEPTWTLAVDGGRGLGVTTAVVVVGQGRRARVLNVPSGRELGACRIAGEVTAVAVGPGGLRVATGDARGGVRLFRALTQKREAEHQGSGAVSALAFDPKRDVLWVGWADGTCEALAVPDLTPITRRSWEGSALAVAGDGEPRSCAPGGLLGLVVGAPPVVASGARVSHAGQEAQAAAAVTALAVHPAWAHVVLGLADGTVRVWRLSPLGPATSGEASRGP